MIELPDKEKAWDYENGFYLTCHPTRLSKILAHYELFTRALPLAGALVECGVFKGASLVRFAMMRELLSSPFQKPIIGFDTFGPFPETSFAPDQEARQRFVGGAGAESISVEQLQQVLRNNGCGRNVRLVAGDITETVPRFVAEHPELRISLLNLDTDVYEPAVTVLEHLYPLVVPGGIVMLDDYGVFPGETKAVDDYFHGRKVRIQKLPFSMSPAFVVKDG